MLDYKAIKQTPYFLLLIGSLLYIGLGYVMLDMTDQKGDLWKLIVLSFVIVTIGKVINDKIGSGQMILFSSVTLLVGTFHICDFVNYAQISLVFSIALTFGMLEFTWTLPQRCILSVYTVSTTYALTCVYTAFNGHFPLSITGTVLVLISWRGLNSVLQHQAYVELLETSKFKAFKSTVIKLRHEFHNLSMIIQLALHRIDEKDREKREFVIMESAMNRFVKTIDEMEGTETYLDEEYTNDESMVVIGEPKKI